jgi:hypothetical protein
VIKAGETMKKEIDGWKLINLGVLNVSTYVPQVLTLNDRFLLIRGSCMCSM